MAAAERRGARRTPAIFRSGFFHDDRKARFVAIETPRAAETSAAFPLTLNTGRMRDHWHTMSRTGLSPKLARHSAAPFVEVHPDDARRFHLEDGAFAAIASPHGQVELRVLVTANQQPGSLFAPIHWNDATAGRARVGALVHEIVDPVSGQPDSKATPVAIRPCATATQGFLVSRRRLELPNWLRHARMAIPGGEAVAFASPRAPAALHALLSNWLRLAATPLVNPTPAPARGAPHPCRTAGWRRCSRRVRPTTRQDWPGRSNCLVRSGSMRRRAGIFWPEDPPDRPGAPDP